jgi:hypothetical protein
MVLNIQINVGHGTHNIQINVGHCTIFDQTEHIPLSFAFLYARYVLNITSIMGLSTTTTEVTTH